MTIWYSVAGTRFRFYDAAARYAKALGLTRIAVVWERA